MDRVMKNDRFPFRSGQSEPHFAKRTSSYQRKLLACFLLVSFVLFFVFSLLMLNLSNRRYQDELCERAQRTITQARNTCDTLLLGVFRYGLTSVTNDLEVARLMYGTTFGIEDAITAKNILEDMQKYNTYVDNTYIFNFSTGSVLTKLGRISLSSFYDPDMLALIESLPVTSSPVRYYPRTAIVRDGSGHTSQERVWTVIFHPAALGAFALDVNYEDFTGLLNISSKSKYLSSYIINGTGQVLVASDQELFASDFSGSSLLQAVKKQPKNSGNFSFSDPDTHTRYTVYYIQNGYLGLTYISTVENILLDPTEPLFLSVLGLSVLFLILSAAGSILLSGLAYRPVRRLRKALDLPDTPTQTKDEFEQFRQAYVSIQQSNTSLQHSAEAWNKAKTRRMLLNWLEPSTFAQRFTAEDYEPLNSYFSNLQFCCVIFTIHTLPGVSGEAEELRMLKYSIINMMDELCEGQFLMRSVDYSTHQTVHLCNFEQLDRNALEKILRTVLNVVQEHFHSSASAAVGCVVADTDDLPESLKSAKLAAARRFAAGDKTILFFDDPSVLPQEAPYPQEKEAALMQAVRNGNQAEAHTLLHEFFEILRTCRIETTVLYILQFDLACQKLEVSNHLDAQPIDLDRITSPNFTLDETGAVFQARLDNVIHTVNSLREGNTAKLVSRVKQLIAERLCDPNLSVAGLADEVGLSVNYLRNIYKEATGESLSAYITSEKIKLICELLQTSDMTIQEISEKLGFTTRNYFFTFFKKHMGMTPKQYRLMQGNLND